MLPALGLGFGLAGSLAGSITGWMGADAQHDAAMEQIRRMDAQNAQTLGTAESAAGGSGVELGKGSMQLALDNMAAEFRRQHEWAVRQADSAQKLGHFSSVLGGMTGVASSVFSYGQANNWFQKEQPLSLPEATGGPAFSPLTRGLPNFGTPDFHVFGAGYGNTKGIFR